MLLLSVGALPAADGFSLDAAAPFVGRRVDLETASPGGERHELTLEFANARQLEAHLDDAAPLALRFRGYTWDGRLDYLGQAEGRSCFVEIDPLDGFLWASYRDAAGESHDSFGPAGRVAPPRTSEFRFSVGDRDLVVKMQSRHAAVLVDAAAPEEMLTALTVRHSGRDLLFKEACPHPRHLRCQRDHVRLEVGLATRRYRYQDRLQKFSPTSGSQGYVAARVEALGAGAFGD